MRLLTDDYKTCVTAMLMATGYDRDKMLSRRIYPYPYCRAIISETLREWGHTYAEIVSMMGRSHCSYIYMRRQLARAMNNPSMREIVRIKYSYHRILEKLMGGESVTLPMLYICDTEGGEHVINAAHIVSISVRKNAGNTRVTSVRILGGDTIQTYGTIGDLLSTNVQRIINNPISVSEL